LRHRRVTAPARGKTCRYLMVARPVDVLGDDVPELRNFA